MRQRIAFVILLVIIVPVMAQADEPPPTLGGQTVFVELPERDAEATPVRKLKLITEAQTVNFIQKFVGGVEGTADSVMFENNLLIGIGTTTPATKLHVAGDIYGLASKTGGGVAINATQVATLSGTSQWDTGLAAESRNVVSAGLINNGGMYGAQIIARNQGDGSVYAAIGGRLAAANVGVGTINFAYALLAEITKGSGTIGTGYGVFVKDIQATNAYSVYQEGSDDTNVFRGKIVIGQPIVPPAFVPSDSNALNVNGNAHFNGTVTGTNIKARYQDVAEWVPATTDLMPGTVVVLNRERTNEVMASVKAYDTTVAGVVSYAPGISLGVEAAGMEQIATTGRVKVRVDARTNPVHIGDLLVTSATAGMAMRSEPVDVNGNNFHKPGTILGKALEPLDAGVGEILVLLSLQ